MMNKDFGIVGTAVEAHREGLAKKSVMFGAVEEAGHQVSRLHGDVIPGATEFTKQNVGPVLEGLFDVMATSTAPTAGKVSGMGFAAEAKRPTKDYGQAAKPSLDNV